VLQAKNVTEIQKRLI